jgi:hypothetical protein
MAFFAVVFLVAGLAGLFSSGNLDRAGLIGAFAALRLPA